MTSYHFLIYSLLVALTSTVSYAQLKTFQFTELDSLNVIESRKKVVFIYTDWCKYCHQMKNTTFKNNEVITTLNNQFYFVGLNAENKQDITYRGYTFRFKPSGNNTGIHELANQLGTINGKINYPTISIIDEKNEIIFQYDGLLKTDALMAVLNELLKK